MADKLNKLDAAQMFKLSTWLSKHAKDFNGRSYADVAVQASQVMGFKVTVKNIQFARKATGVSWKTPRRKAKSGKLDITTIKLLAIILSEYRSHQRCHQEPGHQPPGHDDRSGNHQGG